MKATCRSESPSVKITLQIPASLVRKVQDTATRQGVALNLFVREALKEKLSRAAAFKYVDRPWMVLAGGLKHLHEENVRIDRLIATEFGRIERQDRE